MADGVGSRLIDYRDATLTHRPARFILTVTVIRDPSYCSSNVALWSISWMNSRKMIQYSFFFTHVKRDRTKMAFIVKRKTAGFHKRQILGFLH